MNCMNNRERLLALFLEKAVKRGEFVLASGQKSNYYINGKYLALDSEGLALMAELILDKIQGLGIEAVGGLTLGADPIVGAVIAIAHQRGMHLDGFIVRKEPKGHGTRNLIEGPVRDGARVAIIEDVTTTGSSALKAIEAVKPLGCTIAKIISLVDRKQGASENFAAQGYVFDPIFNKDELGL
ncbi:MAG: orotate phosphoribosyltransferase [candidate division Zixibacteria bacterium]|nr:orotate phosphoribosyltransferase [candidate division Zixibacteria bacterium]